MLVRSSVLSRHSVLNDRSTVSVDTGRVAIIFKSVVMFGNIMRRFVKLSSVDITSAGQAVSATEADIIGFNQTKAPDMICP